MNRGYCHRLMVATASFLLLACAGPTSPFGGVSLSSGDGRPASLPAAPAEKPDAHPVRFKPARQVLHGPSDLEIQVNSPVPLLQSHRLKLIYNGRDLSRTFSKRMEKTVLNDKSLRLAMADLKLRSDQKHDITLFYTNDAGTLVSAPYLPPTCNLREKAHIASLAPFSPEEPLVEHLQDIAARQDLNPAFLAGLIAQESGFDPQAVSPAHAVGLTQVTPIAEQEVRKLRPDWPTDPRIGKIRPLKLKSEIARSRISAKTDWRLNPELSVEGGSLYLQYLLKYWSRPENQEVLSRIPTADATSVIMASYNSGAFRVKTQMLEAGEKWLEQEDLGEALKYVNRVSSYCYHFAGGED